MFSVGRHCGVFDVKVGISAMRKLFRVTIGPSGCKDKLIFL